VHNLFYVLAKVFRYESPWENAECPSNAAVLSEKVRTLSIAMSEGLRRHCLGIGTRGVSGPATWVVGERFGPRSGLTI
jgi:hypothetical protein